jgi:hypothetical protein
MEDKRCSLRPFQLGRFGMRADLINGEFIHVAVFLDETVI